MRKHSEKFYFLSLLLLTVLLAATSLFVVACDSSQGIVDDAKNDEMSEFTFEVVFADGTSESLQMKTDKTTVGEALLSAGLISGEDGPYGLYVKTVKGEIHEYEDDGMYWGFYVNGEYAVSGVDTTKIENGATYTLKAEK